MTVYNQETEDKIYEFIKNAGEPVPFNHVSKWATTSDVATRNQTFGYVLKMEKEGRIKAELVRRKLHEGVIGWTKFYEVNKE